MIYVLFYLMMLLIIMVLLKIVFQTIINPLNLFNFMWCIPAALSNTGILGLTKPSSKTNIILTILFFNVGFLCVSKYKFIYKSKSNLKYNLNMKKIIIINFFAWITFIPYTIKAIKIMNSKGFDYLRSISFTPSHELVGSTIELMYCQIIIAGIFTATIIMTAIDISLGKLNKCLFIISGVDILLYSFTFAGRIFFFKAIIFGVLAIIVSKNMKFTIKKISKTLKIIIIVLLIGFLSYFTLNRGSEYLSVFESMYIYFVGPLPFFDSLLNNMRDINLMMGKATLGIITVPISILFSFITGNEYNGADYLITQVTATQFNIGNLYKFNAFSTSSYVFIRDFGVIGIIIIPFILGIVAYRIYYNFNKNHTNMNYAFYLLMLYLIVYSQLRYELIFPVYAVIIVLIYIFTKERRSNYGSNFSNNVKL